MINALMGGHLDIAVSNPAVVLPHLKSGRLRALMAIGDKPVKFFPEASTSASLGIEALNWGSNTGLTLAHGTPATIVQTWSAMLKDIAADPGLREKMDSMGINLEYSTPAEYAALWTATEAEVKKLLMRSYGKARPIQ
ncbi:Tripartite tricarboxylate transporter family receptor [compost metagenome]